MPRMVFIEQDTQEISPALLSLQCGPSKKNQQIPTVLSSLIVEKIMHASHIGSKA
jgi:hypothetical protein